MLHTLNKQSGFIIQKFPVLSEAGNN